MPQNLIFFHRSSTLPILQSVPMRIKCLARDETRFGVKAAKTPTLFGLRESVIRKGRIFFTKVLDPYE